MNKKFYNFLCIMLVALGLYRSVIYCVGKLINVSINNHQLFYYAVSPSPMVFDKIYYFAERDVVFHLRQGESKVFPEPKEPHKFKGPWQRQVVHRHAMLYLYRKSPEDFRSYIDYYFCRYDNIKSIDFLLDFQKINAISGTNFKKREMKMECN